MIQSFPVVHSRHPGTSSIPVGKRLPGLLNSSRFISFPPQKCFSTVLSIRHEPFLWQEKPPLACARRQRRQTGYVQGVVWRADGRILASCGDDNTIQVWDRKRGQHLPALRRDRPYERLDSSGIRGLTEGEIATLRALGAVEDAAPDAIS